MKRYDSEKILQDLFSLGTKKHKLTTTEIMNALCNGNFTEEQIDEFYMMCEKANIQLIDNTQNVIYAESTVDESNYSDNLSYTDSVIAYRKDIGKYPLLTKEQEQELGRMIKEGSETEAKAAKTKLINSNLRLVVSIVNRYTAKNSSSYADCIQNGNLGLIEAVNHFDYKRNIRFSTYATYWILQRIRRYSDDEKTVHIPYNKSEEIKRMNKVQADFTIKNGREPSIEELAACMEISEIKVKELILYSMDPASLNKPLKDDEDGSELIEFISDDESTQNHFSEMIANKLLTEEILNEARSYLSERELDIVLKRIGLYNGVEYRLEQIAKEYNVTRERVRQIEGKAWSKLIRHNRLRKKNMKT